MSEQKTTKKDLGQKIIDVATGLATVKVRTIVGKIGAAQEGLEPTPGLTAFRLSWNPSEVKVIATEISLIDGDANNFVPDEFLNNPEGASIRDFHDRQVQRAQEISNRNIELMMRVATALSDRLSALVD